MTTFRRITLGMIAATLSVSVASAQIREQQPAEFPPSSFKGKQYVDSNGCVFIRAGIDGDVAWVPRVTRSRKTICGFAPSLAREQVAEAAPVEAPKKAEEIAIAPVAAAAAAPVVAKPQPVRRTVPQPRRAPAPQRVVRQTAPKPVPQPVAPQRVAVAPASVARQVATACPGASTLSQRYLRGDGRSVVRCGPQAAGIAGFGRPRTNALPQIAAASGLSAVAQPANSRLSVTSNQRIVPRHVALQRVNTHAVRVPPGYKPAWADDRLNLHRAEQTQAGRQQMSLIWTNTVPRRLIDRSTGRDVTSSVPLIYPFLDDSAQRRELGDVTIVQGSDGRAVKRISRRTASRQQVPQTVYSTRSAPQPLRAVNPQQPTPRVRARVAAPRPAPLAVAGQRYVQIGFFSTRAKANSAAQRLAGMGMRARIGTVRQGGKNYLSVQAGPFNSPNATSNALSRLRGIGYTGAVAR